jgi:hypothetical protein
VVQVLLRLLRLLPSDLLLLQLPQLVHPPKLLQFQPSGLPLNRLHSQLLQ